MEALLPQRSDNRKAGIEVMKMRIAETPEARKEALDEDNPACWNRRGAYYEEVVRYVWIELDNS